LIKENPKHLTAEPVIAKETSGNIKPVENPDNRELALQRINDAETGQTETSENPQAIHQAPVQNEQIRIVNAEKPDSEKIALTRDERDKIGQEGNKSSVIQTPQTTKEETLVYGVDRDEFI